MRRTTIILIAAAVLTAGAASAGTPSQVANLGYSVTSSLRDGCTTYSATGYGASIVFGSTCTDDVRAAIDAFVAGHNERKLGFQHPAAVTARTAIQQKGYTVDTGYGGPSFTVTGGCNVNQTVDAAGIVVLASSLPAAQPCPEAPPPAPPATTTTTTTPTEPAPDPTVDERLDAIEQRQAELEQEQQRIATRVATLETANVAAWDAFVQAHVEGRPSWYAALAARSAALNALYGAAQNV